MGFFNFFKNKKKNNENNNISDEDINLVEITPFENIEVENEKIHDDIFNNNKNLSAEVVLSNIPDITAEELDNFVQECYENEDIQKDIIENIDEEEKKDILFDKTVEEGITERNNIEKSEEGKEDILFDKTVEEESSEIENIEKVEEENNSKKIKKGFFAKLFAGLDKTRKSIIGGIDNVLSTFTKIDEELFEELEEVLIMADIGVETTMNIIDNLKKRVKKEKTTEPQVIKDMLVDEITAILSEGAEFNENYNIQKPTIMLVIGVNGVGKTTTIGKLSNIYKENGNNVLLAAADTFRAAAIDQLKVWGERANIDVISHEENSDPAAVIFDAVNAAKNRNIDILICDTAGRLHNKKNLMQELKKISKVIDREYPEANKEVYLVLDATTGQNAMQQAKLFKEVANITGIILTKLDGTAKGGIVIAIKSELNIPVKYIGVGESINDLQEFNAKDFASALFGKE